VNPSSCPSENPEVCGVDHRHALVRASQTLGGIDYVEVYPDGLTLCVHFFGAIPKAVTPAHVSIAGGVRIRDIAVTSAQFHEHDDGDLCLMVTIDKTGDFSPYCVCLVQPSLAEAECSHTETPAARPETLAGIDPRYACASFSFRLDCPSTLDCRPAVCAPPARDPLPAIDYLARDYDSFRRLMLDRLAQTMPQWRERHVPDLGITVVELLAYAADQLSYQLDAVASEAFLRTARRRISVRRHARLVDYWMGEGCNARAWVSIASDSDLDLPLAQLAFAAVTGGGANAPRGGGALDWLEMKATPGAVIFEPVPIDQSPDLQIVAAHSEIAFYTWDRDECCLPAGSTRATLRDAATPIPESTPGRPADPYAVNGAPSYEKPPAPPDKLRLQAGDVLIFEEVRGCATGASADADAARRHVVRLTDAVAATDPRSDARVWHIEWNREDALPFDLRLTVRTAAPECRSYPAAVARGNVVLVDHGATVEEADESWVVGIDAEPEECLCDGTNLQQRSTARPLVLRLDGQPVTQSGPAPSPNASARALGRFQADAATPAIALDAALPYVKPKPLPAPGAGYGGHTVASVAAATAPNPWADTYEWLAVRDLLGSGPHDTHVAVEVDDEGASWLRFGDDVNGRRPEAGWRFRARYRVGNGPEGNVGRESIIWLAHKRAALSGVRLQPRNPLPAAGGVPPELIDDVKRYAPAAYGRVLERAVAAQDYALLVADDPRVQGAFGELTWTGSWHEASVAIDPIARYTLDEIAPDVGARLETARRIGHDLRLVPVRRVPLVIWVSICARRGYLRGNVEAAARALLSARILPDGALALFHPDNWRFGADVAASPIVAALQAIAGVEHVELTRFARMDASTADAALSLDANAITIAADEIAIFEADANFPERGRLQLDVQGGR
jgi:hypothetical protein